MAPNDWSWGERYASPTSTMLPGNPLPSASSSHYANTASYFIQPSPPPTLQSSAAPANIPQHLPMQQQSTQQRVSRKRSRDEAEVMEDDDSSRPNTDPFPSSLPSPDKQAVMGPGMTLIYEDRPITDASSQTGTWAEELSERLRTSEITRNVSRPGLESRKSIRLDKSEARMDDIALSVLPRDVKFADDPTIDEASIALGIGWSTVPASSAVAAASRGWARHIEMHFPLQSVKIVWRNTSIPAYLVSAVTCDARGRGASPAPGMGARSASPWDKRAPGSPGYYLFDDSLNQGRLVAKSWERVLQNLRTVPYVFDGPVMTEDADEPVRHAEEHNTQHWTGWKATPTATPRSGTPGIAVPVVVGPGPDGMDLD